MTKKRQAQIGDKVICIKDTHECYNVYKNKIYEIESIDIECNSCTIRGTNGLWRYPVEKSFMFRLYELKSNFYIKKTRVKRL